MKSNTPSVVFILQGGLGSNITIDVLCGIMNNDNVGSPLTRFASVNSLLLKTYSQKCTDFKYDSMITDMKKTDWNSSAAEGGKVNNYKIHMGVTFNFRVQN